MKSPIVRYGVVLAGGQSRRFGSDKALAELSGKPLVVHAVERIQSLGLAACVVTEPHRDYSFLKCPVYFDRYPHLGPIGGLQKAFEIFPGEKILILTCDMPYVSRESMQSLLQNTTKENLVVLYKVHAGIFQPFPGVYDARLQDRIRPNDRGGNSMQSFLKSAGSFTEIDPKDRLGEFCNINTPDELNPSFRHFSES